MLGIKEAFKRIYAGENWLTKQSIIFVITGITSIFSSYMNTLSNQQTPDPSIIGPCFCGLLALLLITFYLCGYGFNITHNSFDETREEILPEFDRSHWGTFGKAFPLLFVWGLYIIILAIFAAVTPIFLGSAGKIVAPILFFLIIIVCSFLQFVYIKFAKNFDKKGLFNITLPFKFIKPTIGSLLMLYLKLLPLIIISLILNVFSESSSVFAYILAAVGGYFGYILSVIIIFCSVQIYKAKVERIEE